MTVPVPLLILALILVGLFTANAIIQGRYLNLLYDRQGEDRAWMLGYDPDYWQERLGREDSGPFINDGPEAPDTPPNCEDVRGFHVAGESGTTCQDCPADLTPVRTV